MFSEIKMPNLDLSMFDTSNVNNMSMMFNGCKVKFLNLLSFKTSNVTDMCGMFSDSNILKVDLSSSSVVIPNNVSFHHDF